MATSRKTIDVLETTKAEGLKTLAAEFPPGTSAWAFWDALVSHSLKEFKAGKIQVLGQSAKGISSTRSNPRRPSVETLALPAETNGEHEPAPN